MRSRAAIYVWVARKQLLATVIGFQCHTTQQCMTYSNFGPSMMAVLRKIFILGVRYSHENTKIIALIMYQAH